MQRLTQAKAWWDGLQYGTRVLLAVMGALLVLWGLLAWHDYRVRGAQREADRREFAVDSNAIKAKRLEQELERARDSAALLQQALDFRAQQFTASADSINKASERFLLTQQRRLEEMAQAAHVSADSAESADSVDWVPWPDNEDLGDAGTNPIPNLDSLLTRMLPKALTPLDTSLVLLKVTTLKLDQAKGLVVDLQTQNHRYVGLLAKADTLHTTDTTRIGKLERDNAQLTRELHPTGLKALWNKVKVPAAFVLGVVTEVAILKESDRVIVGR